MLKNKKIVVTGGAGFIGSNLVEELVKTNQVIVIDNLQGGKRENLTAHKNLLFFECDITNKAEMKELTKGSEIIFHLGALPSITESFKNIEDCIRVNIEGTAILLEVARENKIPRFIFSSTSALYGDDQVVPKVETMRTSSKSPYASSKIIGEQFCKIYFENYGIKTISLRYANVYGKNQDPKSEYAGVISKFIDGALNDNHLEIFGDGKSTRDFIYVTDVVQANIKAALVENGYGEAYNIGTMIETSIGSLAKNIIKITKSQSVINYLPERKGDVKLSFNNNNKAKTILRWVPRINLKTGLTEMLINAK